MCKRVLIPLIAILVITFAACSYGESSSATKPASAVRSSLTKTSKQKISVSFQMAQMNKALKEITQTQDQLKTRAQVLMSINKVEKLHFQLTQMMQKRVIPIDVAMTRLKADIAQMNREMVNLKIRLTQRLSLVKK